MAKKNKQDFEPVTLGDIDSTIKVLATIIKAHDGHKLYEKEGTVEELIQYLKKKRQEIIIQNNSDTNAEERS